MSNIVRIVLEECERAFGEPPLSRRRRRHALRSRWAAIRILRELDFSANEIAYYLGLGDHSTVFNALKRIEQVATAEGWWARFLHTKERVRERLIKEESPRRGLKQSQS